MIPNSKPRLRYRRQRQWTGEGEHVFRYFHVTFPDDDFAWPEARKRSFQKAVEEWVRVIMRRGALGWFT